MAVRLAYQIFVGEREGFLVEWRREECRGEVLRPHVQERPRFGTLGIVLDPTDDGRAK
jgi:hypothetical protein